MMQLRKIFCICLRMAILHSLILSVLAAGTASVYNNCGIEIYYKVISTSEQNYTAIPETGVHVPYSLPGVGVSIKLSLSNANTQGPITQFEYTWGAPSVSYDLSNIGGDPFSSQGYPFAQYGLALQPSSGNSSHYPTCNAIICPPGVLYCSAAYNVWNDTRTLTCNEDTDLTLFICPGEYEKKRHQQIRRHSRGSARRAGITPL
jgi:hypothetical protein